MSTVDQRRRRALLHSGLLMAAMLAVFAACGWAVAGGEGVAFSFYAGVAMLLLVRRLPPTLLLGALGAREIRPQAGRGLYAIRDELCRRAGIARPPRLYWVGARLPIAFTIGQGEATSIALSQDLVRGLTVREVRAILAHELVHVRNKDIALMQFAIVLGRLTRSLAQIAFVLLIASVWLRAFAVAALPLPPLLLLLVAPVGIDLLRLALSRTREMEADLEAAELTGDPQALAAALIKIRERERSLLRSLLPNAAPSRLPPLFRDHPATEERIRRLLAMPQREDASAADDTPGLRIW